MELKDINYAARIHSQQFPHSRSTRLGKPFVAKMYKWFCVNQPDLSLVAEKDGEIIGLAVGSIGGYGRKIFRYAFFEIFFGLLSHPWMVFSRSTFSLWRSFLQGLIPSGSQNKNTLSTPKAGPVSVIASLSSIAVAHDAQGKGVGRSLLDRFEQNAYKKGATRLSLSVEIDNYPAMRLYEVGGWVKERIDVERGSVHFGKEISREANGGISQHLLGMY